MTLALGHKQSTLGAFHDWMAVDDDVFRNVDAALTARPEELIRSCLDMGQQVFWRMEDVHDLL